jgi:hypothetical protein
MTEAVVGRLNFPVSTPRSALKPPLPGPILAMSVEIAIPFFRG